MATSSSEDEDLIIGGRQRSVGIPQVPKLDLLGLTNGIRGFPDDHQQVRNNGEVNITRGDHSIERITNHHPLNRNGIDERDSTDHSDPGLVSGTERTGTDWHSLLDGPVRRMIRGRILNMMRQDAMASVSGSDLPDLNVLSKLPDVATKLEHTLYHNSSSREEYSAPTSIRRRLQGIAVARALPAPNPGSLGKRCLLHSYNANTPRFGSPTSTSSEKNGLPRMNSLVGSTSKRRKQQRLLECEEDTSGVDGVLAARTSESIRKGMYSGHQQLHMQEHCKFKVCPFTFGQSDIACAVYGFLDAFDIMKSLFLCRAALECVPLVVTTLTVYVQDFEGFTELYAECLPKFAFLKEVHLLSRTMDGVEKSQRPTDHSKSEYRRFRECSCYDTLVHCLADGFRAGMFGYLHTMVIDVGLISQMTVKHLMNSIRNSSHSIRRLALSGCGFGSEGAMLLAELINSGTFGALEVLELRGNFIDQPGFHALLSSVCQSRLKLTLFDLSSNLLNDTSVRVLNALLRQGHLAENIEKLSLTHNFISDRGIIEFLSLLEEGILSRMIQLDFFGNTCNQMLLQKLDHQTQDVSI